MRAVLTRASAALDRGVARFFERRMVGRPAARPEPITGARATSHADPRAHLLRLAADYSRDTLGTPSPFFPAPPEPAARVTPIGDGPLGTQIVDLQFASDYAPFHPDARELHQRATANLTAHARWWTSGRGRPTIVLVHGWGGGHHWVTERAFALPYWLRHGYDVAAFVLPYHGERAPGTHPMRSGALFPSPNPLLTNEAFGQAIFDLRALSRLFRARGSPAVGAMGMSLGGYTTALWASVAGPEELGGVDFAVAMIPAVSMAHLMWHHGEGGPARRRAAKAGVTVDLLVDAFAVHTPTTRPARLPRERLFVVAGKGDRITPPEQASALAAHWGVDVRWFDGGHLAQVGRQDVLRDVRRAIGQLGFTGRTFRAPRR